jgi:hypothetical protein
MVALRPGGGAAARRPGSGLRETLEPIVRPVTGPRPSGSPFATGRDALIEELTSAGAENTHTPTAKADVTTSTPTSMRVISSEGSRRTEESPSHGRPQTCASSSGSDGPLLIMSSEDITTEDPR